MNQLISLKNIARRTLTRLMDNILFPELCYKNFSDTFQKRGDTILVPLPVRLDAKEFTDGGQIQTQDVVEDAAEMKLDKLATVDVEFSAVESAVSVDSLDALFVEPAADALAEKINRDGMMLYRDVKANTGIAGTPPDSIAAFAAASLILNENKVPLANRKAVWSPHATSRLQQIPAVVSAQSTGSSQTIRTGEIGTVFGLENHMSQAVCYHEAGTLSGTTHALTITKKNAGDSPTLEITASGGSSVDISGKGLVRGDILFADDYDLLVRADCTASSTTKITVPVSADDFARANVNDVVTLIQSHEANLVFHPQAFAFASRPLSSPAGVESYTVSRNGISLRVVHGYDMKHKRDMLSMDVLYGYKTIRPEMAVRFLG